VGSKDPKADQGMRVVRVSWFKTLRIRTIEQARPVLFFEHVEIRFAMGR
jgi:hypothetical protein